MVELASRVNPCGNTIVGPVEKNQVFVLGFDETMSKDVLELNLEAIPYVRVIDIKYGVIMGVALVTFQERVGKTLFLQ